MRKPKTARIKVKFTPSPEFVQWKNRLAELVDDPQVFQQMLQYAVAKTFLKAIRERFVARLPEALDIHPASRNPKARKVGRDLKQSLNEALDELTEAGMSGSKSKIDKAQRRVTRLQKAYQDALQGDHGRNSKRVSRFALLVNEAMRVMNLMASPEAIRAGRATRSQTTVGLGPLAELESIETPTGNRSGVTNSRMTTLWRQLEYGTGIYALDKSVNADSEFKEPSGDGEWWWGPERGAGVLVAGSMPINALLAGVPLDQRPETEEFIKELRALLAQALAL